MQIISILYVRTGQSIYLGRSYLYVHMCTDSRGRARLLFLHQAQQALLGVKVVPSRAERHGGRAEEAQEASRRLSRRGAEAE